jgi:aryl-alcohol dehydrogenase-like predicted oxidoreductase
MTGDRGMEYTQLGRSGLSVSRLCLGTMNFGPETPEPESHAIMDRAHDVGLNFFDTADVYGWQPGEGITEHIVGRWLAQGGGRRERTVLATKLYEPMSDWPNDAYLSARHIRRACDDSLRRLQTDHIDLYQLHHVDRRTPWDEIWEALEVLRCQGKIIYVGTSNHAAWHIAKGMEAARRRGSSGIVSEQSIYNLLTRDVELEVLPACQDYGVGVLTYSPLGAGLLSGILRKLEDGTRELDKESGEMLRKHRSAIQAWEELCDQLGEKPADVGVAWLLHQPAVTAPVIGPRTLEQFEGSLRALQITLDPDVLARLDELFPGPGGPAPEAYAW